MTGAVAAGLLDDSVVLAQFVQVVPENRLLDFDVPTILSLEDLDDLLRAVAHQLSHVSTSGVSIFKRLLLRERAGEQLGDVLVFSTGTQTVSSSDRYHTRAFKIPDPKGLLQSLDSVEHSALEAEEIADASGRIAYTGIDSLIRDDPRDLALETCHEEIETTKYLESLLGDRQTVVKYLYNIAPLALGSDGKIVFICPRVHRGGQSLTEKLGGGGCLFVIRGDLSPQLVELLYAFSFRLSAAVVDLFSVARALDQGVLYERALQVFGHHAGRIFQESGLVGLGCHEDLQVRLAARRLHVAWGVSEATRILKREEGGLPRDWLAEESPDGFEQLPLAQVLRNVCSFYLFAGESLHGSWGIEWQLPGKEPDIETVAAGREGQRQEEDGATDLPVLPGLKDERATVALTFGLAELLRNARKGAAENSAALIKSLGSELSGLPVIAISIEDDRERLATTVSIRSLHLRESPPWSRTIKGIQTFENACLQRNGEAIVESGQFGPDESLNDQVQWVRATWKYCHGLVRKQVVNWRAE